MVYNNIKTICRTCLSETKDMKSVFVVEHILEQVIMLSEIIMSCASVQIYQGDGLPEQVCLQCAQEVNRSFIFRKLCEKSNAALRENLCHLYNNQENTSIIPTNLPDINIEKPELHAISNETYLGNDFSTYTDKTDNEEDICDELPELEEPTNISKYACNICNLEFKTQRQFKSHRDCHKTAKKPKNSSDSKRKRGKLANTCNVCNKSFRFQSNLVRHRVIHTGEKPFLCNVCGKGFRQLSYLRIHTFIHTGEKPYKCDKCDRSFAAPGTLMTHIRTHTGERPHVCQLCGKDFPQSGYLAAHIRSHTGEKPVECQICHQRFNQSGRLKIHMRKHSGEKPFSCKECGRKFAVKGTLKKHMRTHTGEKPYRCQICEQTFAQSGTLATHMKIHKNK